MKTTRIMCTVKYDGSQFFGYQIQSKGRTVQLEIERALKKIAKQDITTHAAGRTDSGVHALGQVFHFDSPLDMEPHRYKKAFNSLLPKDVYVMESCAIPEEFHSRFHAKTKEYHYRLSTNEHDPLTCNYVHYHRRQLNADAIKEAMTYFIGTHDFTSFTSNLDDINKVRTIYKAELTHDDGEYLFKFVGSGFMKYMVRIMIGTLLQVGTGKRQPVDIKMILEKCDRSYAGPTAKPEGLYLHSVEYEL